MRKYHGLAAACALLVTVQTFAQAIDRTILVNWNLSGGSAGTCSYFQGTKTASFMDTAGENWTSLQIRIPLAVGPAPAGSPRTGTVSVAINGVQVGDATVVSNTSSFCGPWVTYEFSSASLVGYKPFQLNTFTITNVGASVGNGGEKAELIFTIEPRKFAFELVPAMSQKMIIHPVPNDRNLSAWQVPTGLEERPRFRFRGAVSANVSGTSLESDVWLRVVDPADPSLYLPEHFPNDNKDPQPKGVLMSRGCMDATCRAAPGEPLRVRSSPGGVVEVELEGTGRYAGDNYYLESSFDPAFTCATGGLNGENVCGRSGLVTAWKRVFIEKRRMLRNGLFLARDAQAGDDFIITRGHAWGGNRGRKDFISKDETVILVHAPQLDRSDVNAGWYSERHTVLSVEDLGGDEYRVNLGTKQGKNTIPELLQHDYLIDVTDRRIGDAVSKVDSLSASETDVYDALTDLVTGEAFLDAFTENVILPDEATSGASAFVPYLATVDATLLQNLAEKWSSVVTDRLAPNHQLLIIAAADKERDVGQSDAGVTTTLQDRTSSWVFKYAIEGQLKGKDDSRLERWAMKTSAHEIAHQWRTNRIWQLSDHCPADTKSWSEPAAFCLLAAHTPEGAGTTEQRTNGIARFHFLKLQDGTVHSEYLGIRQRPDPFVPEGVAGPN